MSSLARWSRACIAIACLAACGGGGGDAAPAPVAPTPPAPAVPATRLLFFGNSHTAMNDLTGTVAAMVRTSNPERPVTATVSPSWLFLEERASDRASIELVREGGWAFVVLQAQKYSSSGQFEYSIDGAVDLVRLARSVGAVPILFPEWPRRGVNESQRIYDLHVSIARVAPACVAPIPQAFDLAAARHPTIDLHASDGNHSSPAGAFLAALVIAATMTGTAPDQVPYLERVGVEAATQAALRQVAAETVLAYRPRQWCPADSP